MKLHGVILLQTFVTVQGWSCVSTVSKAFSRMNTTAVLRFDISAYVNQQTQNTFKVRFHDNAIQAIIIYTRGVITTDTLPGIEVTGDISGNVVFTKVNVGRNNSGIYYIISSSTPTRCTCLYILGSPTTPSVSVNSNPSVGGSVTLLCTSTSTTTPSNHSLGVKYSWRVDDTDNPSGSRYSYSTSRETLTLSNIVKDDAKKNFTCTATEDVDNGYTSSRSNSVTLDVPYGPDNVQFIPATIYYERAENTNMTLVTCTASCNPQCSFKWNKVGHATAVSNNAVLSLGVLSRTIDGTYSCTVERLSGSTVTKDLTVKVVYGPYNSSTELSPVDKDYIRNEDGTGLSDIKCSADCYPSCKYTWTKLRQDQTTTINTTNGVLSLGSLNRADAGTYICSVTNPGKTRSPTTTETVTVRVRYGPDASEISVQSPFIITEGDEEVPITCSSDCYPQCTYRWNNVTSGKIISANAILSLSRVNKYFSGNYTCISSNLVTQYIKTSERNISILVKGQEHTDNANCKMESNNSTIIVGVILGIACVVQAVYITYFTISNKRKTLSKGTNSMDNSSKPDTYVNLAFATNVTECQEEECVATSTKETSDGQYTDLCRYTNTDKDAYDVIEKI